MLRTRSRLPTPVPAEKIVTYARLDVIALDKGVRTEISVVRPRISPKGAKERAA